MGYWIGEWIHVLLYVLLFSGITIFFQEDFKVIILRIKMGRRLRLRMKQRKENPFIHHMELLAGTVTAGRLSGKQFITASGVLLTAVTVTGFQSYSPFIAVVFGMLIGCMPYVLCRIRLESMRRKASFEGEQFMAMLLSKYRLSSFNMRHALETMASDDKTPPLCRQLLLGMILSAQAAGSEEKIKEAFRFFEFAVNTNWSRMASYNMTVSYISGIDVSDALEDIVVQLREARTMTEERKRMNAESVRLVMIMVPASYVVSMLLAVKYVGVEADKLIRNQFFTSEGFAFFIFILFLFLANTAILKILENKRFDY